MLVSSEMVGVRQRDVVILHTLYPWDVRLEYVPRCITSTHKHLAQTALAAYRCSKGAVGISQEFIIGSQNDWVERVPRDHRTVGWLGWKGP